MGSTEVRSPPGDTKRYQMSHLATTHEGRHRSWGWGWGQEEDISNRARSRGHLNHLSFHSFVHSVTKPDQVPVLGRHCGFRADEDVVLALKKPTAQRGSSFISPSIHPLAIIHPSSPHQLNIHSSSIHLSIHQSPIITHLFIHKVTSDVPNILLDAGGTKVNETDTTPSLK